MLEKEVDLLAEEVVRLRAENESLREEAWAAQFKAALALGKSVMEAEVEIYNPLKLAGEVRGTPILDRSGKWHWKYPNSSPILPETGGFIHETAPPCQNVCEAYGNTESVQEYVESAKRHLDAKEFEREHLGTFGEDRKLDQEFCGSIASHYHNGELIGRSTSWNEQCLSPDRTRDITDADIDWWAAREKAEKALRESTVKAVGELPEGISIAGIIKGIHEVMERTGAIPGTPKLELRTGVTASEVRQHTREYYARLKSFTSGPMLPKSEYHTQFLCEFA